MRTAHVVFAIPDHQAGTHVLNTQLCTGIAQDFRFIVARAVQFSPGHKGEKAVDPEMLQNFANSWLAEPWEDTKLKTTEDLVKERQTEYEESEVPDWAVELTGGIDVQETSVYWVIRAWGEHWTSQLVARGQAVNLWEVDGIMNLNYQKRDGTQMAPSLVLVDSGDQTDMVYDFCVDTAEYTLPSKGASKKLETDYKISTINKAGSRAISFPLPKNQRIGGDRHGQSAGSEN